MNRETIAKVQSFGFSVYMRKPTDSYLFFTDGKNIGYLQDGDFGGGFSFSTVHKPNTTTGTGYQIGRNVDDFTEADLKSCFVTAPEWAWPRDRPSVVKYRDIGEFIDRDSFNRELKLIEPVA